MKVANLNVTPQQLLLYAVTDSSWLGERTLEQAVQQAINGGISFLQLREKQLSAAAALPEALALKKLAAAAQIPFVINDDVDLALACEADGVHVGQHDCAASIARARLGAAKILGVSVQTVEQARLAAADGADYLGVGAVFSTSTKNDADSVTLTTLAEICRAVDIPVIAIGGINHANLPQLNGCGLAGVAVVSAIFAAENITAATRELRLAAERLVSDECQNQL